MTRHRFDPLSFIFGLLFAGAAAVALIGVEVVSLRDLAWIAPSLLVVAGAALLISSAGRSRPEESTEGRADTDAPAQGDTPTADRTDGGSPHEAARASDAPEMGHASEDR